ncbi:hypothetical protein [Rhodanobacter koreensis]
MKTLLVSALLVLAPLGAHATCAPTDFEIKDFNTGHTGAGATLKLSLSGQLVNKCAAASAAQIRIEAKDASGNVLQTKQGWPAGTTNIAPGQAASFDLGRQFRFQPEMASYSVTVVAVRTW